MDAAINIIKFCVRIKSEFLNSLFENNKHTIVVSFYNIINCIKTYLFKIVEVVFSCNMESHKNRHSKVYNVITVKEFCKMNNYKYLTIEKEQYRNICIPHYYTEEKQEKIIKAISPEIYIAEIDKANIIGENSVIISENYCLYDMAKRDKDKRYDLRFSSIRNINEYYAIVQSINYHQKITKAISLVGFAPYNYYHFTIELLSRMQYIDRFKEYISIPILIDEKVLNIPQYKELLDIVNENNHPIIPIKKHYIYEVEKLIYPSYNSWLPINLKKGGTTKSEDFLMANSAAEYIRNKVFNISKIQDETLEGHRKIFISRKNTKNKRLINEEVLIEIIKKYNFEIVYPEELTFMEQVKLFSEAKYIVGSTGAAFTNIIFCPKNVTVICIIPKKYMFYTYSTISKILDLKCVFLDAEVIKEKQAASMEYYKMDVDYYEKCIEEIMDGKEI